MRQGRGEDEIERSKKKEMKIWLPYITKSKKNLIHKTTISISIQSIQIQSEKKICKFKYLIFLIQKQQTDRETAATTKEMLIILLKEYYTINNWEIEQKKKNYVWSSMKK